MIGIRHLQEINRTRATRWHREGPDDWSPLEWAGAMAGEAGEACNAAKKLKRVESQIHHHDNRTFGDDPPGPELAERYRIQVAREAADTIIYAILLIERVGLDAETTVRDVFNKKSEEYGFPERLE